MQHEEIVLGDLQHDQRRGWHYVAPCLIPAGTVIHDELPLEIAQMPLTYKHIVLKETDFKMKRSKGRKQKKDKGTMLVTPSKGIDTNVACCPTCYAIISSVKNRVSSCQKCFVIYCSDECLEKDKNIHEKECHNAIRESWTALPVRMLARGIVLPSNVTELHFSEEDKRTIMTRLETYVAHLFPEYTIEELFSYFAKVQNMLKQLRTFLTRVLYGYAAYDKATFYNHSCDPNAHFYMIRARFLVKASRDIQQGEEITVRYTEDCMPLVREDRIQGFSRAFPDDCICDRCLDVERCKREQVMFFFRTRLKVKTPVEITGMKAADAILDKRDGDMNDILALHRQFHDIFGFLNSTRFNFYYKLVIELFHDGYGYWIYDFPSYMHKYLKGLRKCGIVKNTVLLMGWTKIMLYFLNLVRYNTTEDFIENQTMLRAFKIYAYNHIEKWLDMDILEVDQAMYGVSDRWSKIFEGLKRKEIIPSSPTN